MVSPSSFANACPIGIKVIPTAKHIAIIFFVNRILISTSSFSIFWHNTCPLALTIPLRNALRQVQFLCDKMCQKSILSDEIIGRYIISIIKKKTSEEILFLMLYLRRFVFFFQSFNHFLKVPEVWHVMPFILIIF